MNAVQRAVKMDAMIQDRAVETEIDGPVRARVTDLNFYYGEKQALFDVSFPIHDRKVTAHDRAIGLRQEHNVACHESHARSLSWQPLSRPGDPVPRRDQYRFAAGRSAAGSPQDWDGVSEAESFPEVDLRQCRVGTVGARHSEKVGGR